MPARPVAAHSRFIDWTAPFSLFLVLLLASLVLLPMFRLLVTSLTGDARQLTLEHYRQLFVDPAFVRPLLTTLWTSAAVGVLCVIAAAPMGWLVARTDLPAKRLLRTLILASFVTPPFLGAFAWVLLGGPNAGLVNQWYYALTGLKPFEAAPLINIFSAGGMVFVMALYTFPYVFTFVANSLDAIPGELEEASAILGAPTWRTARRNHAAAGRAGAAGGVPDRLSAVDDAVRDARDPGTAGRHRYDDHEDLEPVPVPAAARIGRGRVAAPAAHHGRAVAGADRDHGPARLRRDRRQEHRHAPDPPCASWTIPALALFAFVLGASIVLPYGVLVRTAFVKNWSAPVAGNLSLEHWRFVFFEFSQTRLAFENTFVLGIAAATVGTVLVTIVGYLSLRKLVWGHRYLGFLATAPVAIPGIVLAVGLFLTYAQPPFVLYGTLAIIFLAYLTKELPVGYQQVGASLKAVHPELEDASRIFGATRLRALFDITTPLIRNGVIATWIFIFIGSIRELSATILLFTARTKTISVTMFDLRESNDWGPIAVLSVTMLLITFAMILLINHFTDRRST